MSTPLDSGRNEQPSTYFVQDRENRDELSRLTIQDRMLTASMGGVLPEQPDPSIFRRVLDVGCGSGSWVIEAAQTYPTMSLVGIDISKRMIDYDREQAKSQQVEDRVTFRVMDALRMLEFPPGSFDLVNLRFGVSFMRTWDWPKLLVEMLRVTRPGGTVRITDQEIVHQTNMPPFRSISEMLVCAFYRAGHLFEEESTGLVAHLAPLLTQYGCEQVQTRSYTLEFRAGMPEFEAYYADTEHAFKTLHQFFQKWGCSGEDYEATARRTLAEMRTPDFRSTWNLLSAWGIKP